MRSAMFALEIHSQRAPGGVEGGVIKRGRARDTAYPVGSKKLFGHEKSLSLQTVWPGPVRASFRADNLTNLSTRKTAALLPGSVHAHCITGPNQESDRSNPWICRIEAEAHEVINVLRECVNV